MTLSPADAGVFFVTDRNATLGRPLMEVIQGAIAGGADRIMVREKDLQGAELLQIAKGVVEAARAAGGRCRVIVNDRLDVALAARAAGVHLPADGLPVAGVREHAGKKFLVGRSVHSLSEARQAEKERVDYIVVGPVFTTPSKASFGPPLGPAVLRRIVEAVRLPVWAIGGIVPGTAAQLRGIPIAGVAAIGAIAGAADPAAAVRELRAALAAPATAP